MFNKMIFQLPLSALALALSSQVFAGLMLETYDSGEATPETLGTYAMTDFELTNVPCATSYCMTSSVALPDPLTGTIDFQDYDGNALAMHRSTANNTGWWVNPEATDNDIYTTHVNWVELVLPENTRAFSFNVGASFNGWGWMVGFNGVAQEMYSQFNVGSDNTPGFGVYADNTDGSCGAITSIIIDPAEWGVGNFSINQSECTASVPEPGVLSLLGVGLFGLGYARKRYSA